MILNPTHDITLRGLPSEILDAYVRYKKGSRAIVAWLVQFGPEHYKGVKTLPIKELALLAQLVVTSIKELPDIVHFHFKETIAARQRLSHFFRKRVDLSQHDADTVNHEHFTASLAKIYSDLCNHCQDQIERQTVGQTDHRTILTQPIKNQYACLPVEICVESCTSDTVKGGCEECKDEAIFGCHTSQVGLGIENDEMSIAIETATILEQMHETLTMVKSCWDKVGKGEVHFLSAAGVTNMAWSTLQALEDALKHDGSALTLTALHQRCCYFNQTLTDADDYQSNSKLHSLLKSLEESDRAVRHYTDCCKLTVAAHCPSCARKPSDYLQEPSTYDVQQTASFSMALLNDMLHFLCSKQSTPPVVQSSPMLATLSYLLSHRDDRTTSFRCVLGIQLLVTAYRAHVSALPQPDTISACRITALQLSRQATRALTNIIGDKDSFPCRCPQTLAFHLVNLQDDMEAYSKYKRWDLYFQSPWVAGTHIVEMLDTLSYYGMHLFRYRHYFGAVLHSYNVLVHLAGLDRIPLLEQLCEIFEDVLFPSGRPTMHFKNSWARYVGARLKFKKGNKRHDNDKDSWCMAVPAHVAKSSAGLDINNDRTKCCVEPQLDYGRIDPLIELKQVDWRADLTEKSRDVVDGRKLTAPLSSSPSSSRPTTSSSFSSGSEGTTFTSYSNPTEDHSHHPFLAHLNTFQVALGLQPPSPTLPTTSLNHFAIFSTILSVIRTITAGTHSDDHNSSSECKLCICFAHTLLAAADRIFNARRFGRTSDNCCWRKEERPVVEAIKKALVCEVGSEQEARARKRWVWEL